MSRGTGRAETPSVLPALIIVVCITALGSNANGTFTRVGSAVNVGS